MNRISETLERAWTRFRESWVGEAGASMVEYGLLLALVAVVALAAFQALGTSVSTTADEVSTEIDSAGS